MSGSVSTRTANRQAERVTASGQLRLPSCCGALPEKSSVSRSPSTVARRRSGKIAFRRLEHVLGEPLPVRERREARTGPALGVVEHGVGGITQPIGAEALGQRREPRRPRAVGGELGEQVRAALRGLAHATGELVDRLPGERAR